MNPLFKLAFIAVVILFVLPAKATLITFDDLPSDFLSGPIGYPDPNAILTDDLKSVGIIFGKEGTSAGVAVLESTSGPGILPDHSSQPNRIVGLDAKGYVPGYSSADIFFHFVTPDTNIKSSTDFVSFSIGDSGYDLDIFNIKAFNIYGELIFNDIISGTSFFTTEISAAGIHAVEIDFDDSNKFGYSLDDLFFNTIKQTSVPEPSSALLIVFCLLVLRHTNKIQLNTN